MNTMRIPIMRLIAPVLLAGLAAASPAQSRPKVSALLSSGVVKYGATAQLKVEVEGSRNARIMNRGAPPRGASVRSPPIGTPRR